MWATTTRKPLLLFLFQRLFLLAADAPTRPRDAVQGQCRVLIVARDGLDVQRGYFEKNPRVGDTNVPGTVQ